jgi:carboxylesterase type B
MTSPLAKGLFARAIGESGGALTPIAAFGPKPLQAGERDGGDFVASIGANSLADLRARPATELLEAILKKPITYGLGVVDGYVVPEHPASVFAKGGQNDVPLPVGWNADEATLFAARVAFPAGAPSYADRVRAQFKDQAELALKLYPPGSTRRMMIRRHFRPCWAMRSSATAAGHGPSAPPPPERRRSTATISRAARPARRRFRSARSPRPASTTVPNSTMSSTR